MVPRPQISENIRIRRTFLGNNTLKFIASVKFLLSATMVLKILKINEN